MNIRVHHLDKWAFINLDLVSEVLEKRRRCAILIGGATSSGKSFSAEYLESFLNRNHIPTIIVSTDNYNKGISGIITDKIDQKIFSNSMPSKDEIKSLVKNIIINSPFEEKFNDDNCQKIAASLSNFLTEEQVSQFIKQARYEFSNLSFDEPSVYDLNEVAKDIKTLLSGKNIIKKKYSKVVSERQNSTNQIIGSKYKVIIVEGIYVLTDKLKKQLDQKALIANFVEGNPKSLFLRRVIRDSKITSLPSYLTVSMYFNYIAKSYKESIRPSMKNADIILDNNMSFSELREGTLYMTKEKIKITNPEFITMLWQESKTSKTVYQKDIYIAGKGEPEDLNSIVRMREISSNKGKTYVPSSLVSKGVPKYRKDNKEIRPINILLSEDEFLKAFSSEEDFIAKIANADMIVQKIVYKTKRYLKYKGLKMTLTDIKNDGMYLELTDTRLNDKEKEALLLKASK